MFIADSTSLRSSTQSLHVREANVWIIQLERSFKTGVRVEGSTARSVGAREHSTAHTLLPRMRAGPPACPVQPAYSCSVGQLTCFITIVNNCTTLNAFHLHISSVIAPRTVTRRNAVVPPSRRPDSFPTLSEDLPDADRVGAWRLFFVFKTSDFCQFFHHYFFDFNANFLYILSNGTALSNFEKLGCK